VAGDGLQALRIAVAAGQSRRERRMIRLDKIVAD
jgi:hypothetical protein